MRLLLKVLKVVGIVLVVVVALVAFLVWWGHPKRPVNGLFAREAGPEVFKFTDIPKGRALSPEEADGFAHKLVSEMTLQEKVLQMSGDSSMWDLVKLVTIEKGKYNDYPITAGASRRLAIPPIGFSDGPRGVVMDHSTCFPSAMARGASFDRELQRRVGDAIGKEIRAQGGNLWGGVCVNLLRHPSWGRAQETYGEDPFHLGEMALAATEAVQAHNVMGCAKHFALNSIEETRTKVDVHVDERTLREVYLPAFRRLAKADVASFMSAYNQVNGDYCAESRHLLREILKEDWGFRGFVMSDFFEGVHDGPKAARAGLDLEMPWTVAYGKKLIAAVEKGDVAPALLDEAVLRILRRKIEYATRPDPIAYPRSLVRTAEHVALAREAAEKSLVLLKNEGGLLPLDSAGVRSVAVVGRLADAPNLGDYGSSRVYPPDTVTVLEGLREALGASRVLYEPGVATARKGEAAPKGQDPLSRARAAAKAADVAVVVAGFDHSDEGEYIPQRPDPTEWGGDRVHLGLKPVDIGLIQAVAAENPKTVVVLVGGATITVEEWHDAVGAIVMAFYPGEQGGAALSRLLLGDVSPAGKLPFTVPRDESQLPPFDNRAQEVEYGYYHGYTLMEKRGLEPRYPFGYGLSYTTFSYGKLELDASEVATDGTVHASVEITNAGTRAGDEVAQLYVGFPPSQVDRPLKLLRGFERVTLAPGETKRVDFAVAVKDLAYWDTDAGAWRVQPAGYTVFVGPSSAPSSLLSASFRVRG